MKKFYIVKSTHGSYFLRVWDSDLLNTFDMCSKYGITSLHLCFLHERVFKLPHLEMGGHLQVKELRLKKGAVLTRPYNRFRINVNRAKSGHCSSVFQKYTHKRFHIPQGFTKPVSVIKLKLS
ncbi:hypothetical protein LCGC14_0600920 [marine sediment metagenome]|uniref:Uncharacterized protein n=1 Tax=marine sediment metagenome TaxID=412755 RepID=A0A0F9TWS2_9ZZZZ